MPKRSGFTFLQGKKAKTHSGFTLIELLVVIAIIGVLAAVGYASYSGLQKNARDSKRQSEINSIAQALEIRYQIASGVTCDGEASPSNGGTYCQVRDSWFANGIVPIDTNTNTPYCIWLNATNSLATLAVASSNFSSSGCSAVGTAPSGTTQAVVGQGVPALASATSFWRVCAVLEKTNQPYCVNSKQ